MLISKFLIGDNAWNRYYTFSSIVILKWRRAKLLNPYIESELDWQTVIYIFRFQFVASFESLTPLTVVVEINNEGRIYGWGSGKSHPKSVCIQRQTFPYKETFCLTMMPGKKGLSSFWQYNECRCNALSPHFLLSFNDIDVLLSSFLSTSSFVGS